MYIYINIYIYIYYIYLNICMYDVAQRKGCQTGARTQAKFSSHMYEGIFVDEVFDASAAVVHLLSATHPHPHPHTTAHTPTRARKLVLTRAHTFAMDGARRIDPRHHTTRHDTTRHDTTRHNTRPYAPHANAALMYTVATRQFTSRLHESTRQDCNPQPASLLQCRHNSSHLRPSHTRHNTRHPSHIRGESTVQGKELR